jgi:hypothetical protein
LKVVFGHGEVNSFGKWAAGAWGTCRSTAADQNRPITTVVALAPTSFMPGGGLDLRGRPAVASPWRRDFHDHFHDHYRYPGRRAAPTEDSALLLGSTVLATDSTSAALKVFDEISI